MGRQPSGGLVTSSLERYAFTSLSSASREDTVDLGSRNPESLGVSCARDASFAREKHSREPHRADEFYQPSKATSPVKIEPQRLYEYAL